jgi:hypothetical protein
MTQAELELLDVKVPDAGTQCGVLLRAFQRGERLTVAEALSRYGCFALSQRCGDLRRNGWPIKSEMVEIRPGTRIARYWLAT